jgi:AraC-like DNA-binding protein/mannose-6-phosphate isomerase-like protein (cupin superfamily)
MADQIENTTGKSTNRTLVFPGAKRQVAPVRRIHVDAGRKHDVRFPVEFPLLVNTYRFSPESRVPENYHDYLEISLIQTGSGTLRIEDHVFPLHTGDLIIIGPDTFHTVEVSDTRPLLIKSLHFLPELVFSAGEPVVNSEWLRPFYDRAYLRHPIIDRHESKPVSTRFFELLQTQSNPSEYAHLQTRINLLQVLLEVLKSLDGEAREKPFAGGPFGDPRLERVVSWIDGNLQEKLTLEAAAAVACVSPQHLCRLFKQWTGHTFTEFLTRVRIAKSQRLLLRTDLRATDIAYEVGFGSPSNFFRAFRRVTGATPGSYVRNSDRRPVG